VSELQLLANESAPCEVRSGGGSNSQSMSPGLRILCPLVVSYHW